MTETQGWWIVAEVGAIAVFHLLAWLKLGGRR